MNDVEQVNCLSCLVGLKVPYEVPVHLFAPECGDFPLRFLDAVLTKICRPELTNLPDNCRRMGLADGYEPDLVGATSAFQRCGTHTGANVRKSYCQWFLRRINVSHEI